MKKKVMSSMIVVLGTAFLISACQGHYNPRKHIDETPAPPGQVKSKYYH
tara:strand:- start:1386 stop:1532 length:147 start_codon:yes stop_codon:yes gene_type:complete